MLFNRVLVSQGLREGVADSRRQALALTLHFAPEVAVYLPAVAVGLRTLREPEAVDLLVETPLSAGEAVPGHRVTSVSLAAELPEQVRRHLRLSRLRHPVLVRVRPREHRSVRGKRSGRRCDSVLEPRPRSLASDLRFGGGCSQA